VPWLPIAKASTSLAVLLLMRVLLAFASQPLLHW